MLKKFIPNMGQEKFEHPITYHVWLKRGGPAEVEAFGYSESKKQKRIYFHLKRDLKDKEIFFRTDEIVGVSRLGPSILAKADVSAEGFSERLLAATKTKGSK